MTNLESFVEALAMRFDNNERNLASSCSHDEGRFLLSQAQAEVRRAFELALERQDLMLN